jgi:hypothetical protein
MSMFSVPRCQHLKVNGTQCGSPALKRNRFCFFHKRFQEEQIKLNCDRVRRTGASFYIPVLEDANSIQVSLMQVMRLLASGQIDAKIAGLLLYSLQTASFNLRHVNFEPFYRQHVVIDRSTIDRTCIDGDQWSASDFPDPEETEEEIAAAAAAEEAAIKAAAKEKARRHAAIEAEADRLIRQGALARLARSPAPAPTLPPTIKVPAPPQPQATARVQTVPVPAHAQPSAPVASAPRVETGTRVETAARAEPSTRLETSTRVGTGTLASLPRAESKGPVERSSTASATNPAPAPPSPTIQPPPPPAAKPQEVHQKSAAQPSRPSPTPKPRRKKPPKRADMNQVREQIRGLAQDWIIQTAKQSNSQSHHRSK